MKDYLLEAYKNSTCDNCELCGLCDDEKAGKCLSEFIERTREEPNPIPIDRPFLDFDSLPKNP